MNRREFLAAAGLAAADLALNPESISGGQRKSAKQNETAPIAATELRENTTREAGEAVLLQMARKADPKLRTAAHGRSSGRSGWYFGESEKKGQLPNFRLYARNFEDAFLKKLDELRLYRVGPEILSNNPRQYEQAVAKAVQSKDLIRDPIWLSYLPDFSHNDWAECELLANAHFAFKMQGAARSIIVTPFGQIEFNIQPAATLWAEFHTQFETAEREIEVVREYGEPYATEFARENFDDLENPLVHAQGLLTSSLSLLDLRKGTGEAVASEADGAAQVITGAIHRLIEAQKQFNDRFKKPIEEFDIQKEELIARARDGFYDQYEALLTAVQQLYGTIDVELNFKPAPDMLPLKNKKVA